MNAQAKNVSRKQQVEKPLYKFMIGFVGGFCAAIFPRLMASLAVYGNSEIELLTMDYLLISLVFASLIGGVIMILEWGVLKEPRTTFMTALSLPAILAGAINTSNGAYELDSKTKENRQLADVVQALKETQEELVEEFEPLTDAGDSTRQLIPPTILGIGTAHASDGFRQRTGFEPGMKAQRHYYILIEKAQNKREAKQRAAALKAQVPNVRAVKSGAQFLIIDATARPKSKAMLEIIRLEKKGFKPRLLKKKNK